MIACGGGTVVDRREPAAAAAHRGRRVAAGDHRRAGRTCGRRRDPTVARGRSGAGARPGSARHARPAYAAAADVTDRHRRSRCRRSRRRGPRGVRGSGRVSHAIRVDLGPRSYDVVVGARLRRAASRGARAGARSRWSPDRQVGRRVRRRSSATRSTRSVDHETFLMGRGEEAKTLATVDELCRRFARWGLLRGDARRRGRRRSRRRHRRFRGRGLLPRRRRRAGAHDAARDGRLARSAARPA